jgi:hypothetical protein
MTKGRVAIKAQRSRSEGADGAEDDVASEPDVEELVRVGHSRVRACR